MSLCRVCKKNLEKNGLSTNPEPWDCGEEGKKLDEHIEASEKASEEKV